MKQNLVKWTLASTSCTDFSFVVVQTRDEALDRAKEKKNWLLVLINYLMMDHNKLRIITKMKQ